MTIQGEVPPEAENFATTHIGKLQAYLVTRGCSHERASEIAVDAILIVMLRWSKINQVTARAYLYKVATNLWRKCAAQEGEWRASLVDPHDCPTVSGKIDGVERLVVDQEAARAIVWPALLALDLQLREVLWLRHAEDFKTKQTAGILGIPEGTVKARLHKAVKQFKGLVLESGLIEGTEWDVTR